MSSIPIGRFSKMTRLSVKTLRLYDRRSLLKPAVVDPVTRYRYYSAEQLRDAELIRTMRSLEEIAKLMATDDEAGRVAALAQQRTRLVEQMAARQRMADYLQALIEHRDVYVEYQIEVVEGSPVPVASVRIETRLSGMGRAVGDGFSALVTNVAKANVVQTGSPLVIFHDVIDEDASGEVEMCVPVPAGINELAGLTIRDLEGGLVATTLHKGPTRWWGLPIRRCRRLS